MGQRSIMTQAYKNAQFVQFNSLSEFIIQSQTWGAAGERVDRLQEKQGRISKVISWWKQIRYLTFMKFYFNKSYNGQVSSF